MPSSVFWADAAASCPLAAVATRLRYVLRMVAQSLRPPFVVGLGDRRSAARRADAHGRRRAAAASQHQQHQQHGRHGRTARADPWRRWYPALPRIHVVASGALLSSSTHRPTRPFLSAKRGPDRQDADMNARRAGGGGARRAGRRASAAGGPGRARRAGRWAAARRPSGQRGEPAQRHERPGADVADHLRRSHRAEPPAFGQVNPLRVAVEEPSRVEITGAGGVDDSTDRLGLRPSTPRARDHERPVRPGGDGGQLTVLAHAGPRRPRATRPRRATAARPRWRTGCRPRHRTSARKSARWRSTQNESDSVSDTFRPAAWATAAAFRYAALASGRS